MRNWIVVATVGALGLGCQTPQYAQFKASMAEGYGHVVPGASSINEAQFVHVTGQPIVPIDARATRCTIPTHQDDYAGFTVGHPPGWRINYANGPLMVSRDEHELVAAVIYPVRLRQDGVPPERLVTAFARTLERSVTAGGGTFELTEQKTNGQIATAVAVATVNGVLVRGPIEAIAKPGFMTLKAYWAPQAEMAQDQQTLEQVLGCFQRKTVVTAKAPVAPAGGHVTRIGYHDKPAAAVAAAPSAQLPAMHPLRSKFFTVSAPTGWRIYNDTDHGVELSPADRQAYLGFGFMLNPTQNPAQYIQGTLSKFYAGVQVLQWSQPAAQGWMTAEAEFAGTTHGSPLHGVMRVSVTRGLLVSTLWTTTPARWDSQAATLTAIAGGIEIQPNAIAMVQGDVRRQIASYPKPVPTHIPVPVTYGSTTPSTGMGSYADQTQDNINTAWSDSMRGQDRAVSPTTGEEYVVPTNAWRADGAEGAGYYRAIPGGGEERLNVENVIQGTTE